MSKHVISVLTLIIGLFGAFNIPIISAKYYSSFDMTFKHYSFLNSNTAISDTSCSYKVNYYINMPSCAKSFFKVFRVDHLVNKDIKYVPNSTYFKEINSLKLPNYVILSTPALHETSNTFTSSITSFNTYTHQVGKIVLSSDSEGNLIFITVGHVAKMLQSGANNYNRLFVLTASNGKRLYFKANDLDFYYTKPVIMSENGLLLSEGFAYTRITGPLFLTLNNLLSKKYINIVYFDMTNPVVNETVYIYKNPTVNSDNISNLYFRVIDSYTDHFVVEPNLSPSLSILCKGSSGTAALKVDENYKPQNISYGLVSSAASSQTPDSLSDQKYFSCSSKDNLITLKGALN